VRPAFLRISLIAPLLVTISLMAGTPTAATPMPADGAQFQPSSLATPIVAIQPLGCMDRGLVDAVAERIEESFAVSVVVLPGKPLPQSAFYRLRSRYRGEQLLDWLNAHKPPRVWKILGLMSCDLSVTKGQVYDWGVMGVSALSRPAGVVSVYRLRGSHAPASLVARRAGQVAVHELGHTFGLPHCGAPRCIMNDAKGGIGPVDASSGSFCSECRRRLRDCRAIT
jgi:archaemetzincin